ncbi:hypothetical protein ACJX0J_029782, partial [Zea mays]
MAIKKILVVLCFQSIVYLYKLAYLKNMKIENNYIRIAAITLVYTMTTSSFIVLSRSCRNMLKVFFYNEHRAAFVSDTSLESHA